MEKDYTKLSGPELLQALGDNAQLWAKAFLQITEGKEIDEGLMIGWFANAIEHSTAVRKGKRRGAVLNVLILLSLPLFSSSTFIEYKINVPVGKPVYKQEISNLPPRRDSGQYQGLFEKASIEAGVPIEALEGIAYVESGFNPDAISHTSLRGHCDMGMFQINSEFLDWYAKRYNGGEFDPMDPGQAIAVAARHIKWLYEKYQHWPDVFLAYNAGCTRIDAGKIPEDSWVYLERVYR